MKLIRKYKRKAAGNHLLNNAKMCWFKLCVSLNVLSTQKTEYMHTHTYGYTVSASYFIVYKVSILIQGKGAYKKSEYLKASQWWVLPIISLPPKNKNI